MDGCMDGQLRSSRRQSGISGDTVQLMMMPTDEIDDEETFTYKQNFLQNELNKQNFIYTIDKYRAVFSSVHIIALKVLSHHHHRHLLGQRRRRPPAPEQDDDQTSPQKKPKAASSASQVTSNKKGNLGAATTLPSVLLREKLAATTTVSDGFRIEGKFRFLSKSS